MLIGAPRAFRLQRSMLAESVCFLANPAVFIFIADDEDTEYSTEAILRATFLRALTTICRSKERR
jgi:hypothetical protein